MVNPRYVCVYSILWKNGTLNKKLIIAFFFILMLGSFGLIVIDKAARSRIDNINFIGKVPSFSLTNFDGSIVTEKQLNNKISIVSFMFTQCEGACPIMSNNIATLQERFSSSNDVQFLSITCLLYTSDAADE